MLTGELKKILANVADDLKIVTPGWDHGYNRVFSAGIGFAENYKGGELSEYWDDGNMEEGSRKIEVFVIE